MRRRTGRSTINKTLFNRDLDPYLKYFLTFNLTRASRHTQHPDRRHNGTQASAKESVHGPLCIDPYSLNVLTNVFSYRPRAQLIRP